MKTLIVYTVEFHHSNWGKENYNVIARSTVDAERKARVLQRALWKETHKKFVPRGFVCVSVQILCRVDGAA